VGIGALVLCLDLPPAEKETLLVPYVQVGIDYWGLIEAGHPGWPVLGGHHSGRKLPILIAGMLFDDGRMARPSVTYPKVSFQEDEQTMYGQGWTGATALFAGHSGINKATGRPGRNGPYEHKHHSEWGRGDWTSEGYRRCCTSFTWVSEALALRILHAKENWAHDAFFDYVDRWMTEDDTEHRKEVLKVKPGTGWARDDQTWAHQRNCWDPIVQEMWDNYRKNPPPKQVPQN
jgi:hypothetical protein